MKKWTVFMLIIVLALTLSAQAQAVSISDAELVALKAKDAQLEVEIAKLKAEKIEMQKAIKEMADSAKKDVDSRSLLNKGLETSIVQANKRLDSTETSLLALTKVQDLFAKKQEALEKGQYNLAKRYNDAAVYAKIQEVRRKNQIARTSGSSGTANIVRTQRSGTTLRDYFKATGGQALTGNSCEAINQALTMVGLDEKYKGLVITYASYSQECNMNGFKEYLSRIGEEAKFDQIERAAKYLAQTGYFKLGNPQNTRVFRKDPPAYRIQKSINRSGGSYSKIVQNNSRNRDDRDQEDHDDFYTHVNWSSLLRR
ncbi:MAG: hypothetical protein WC650_02935 [Candidatus Doudnabacteria bacterium]